MCSASCSLPSWPVSRRPALLGLAALAALGLTTAPARAQTQDMFVSSAGNTISRFAGTGPGTFSTNPTTLSGGGLNLPTGLAFDARGDLFAANINGGNSITEFAAGATPGSLGPGVVIETGLNSPIGLAVDARGDLFAGNFGTGFITEFASTGPGTFSATGTTLSGGQYGPAGLAVDARGDLFAANSNNSTITEFAAGATPGTLGASTVALTGGGLNQPVGLAFDARGDLFAANDGNNTITEFASTGPGTFSATSTTLSGGLYGPQGLAVDARGDLFAVNDGNNNITEFVSTGPGTFGAARTVETVLHGGGDYLAFGPSISAPVPEASTTVSLGLLLALGMGGMVVAAKRKKRGA